MFFTESWEKLCDDCATIVRRLCDDCTTIVRRLCDDCVYNMIEYSIMFFIESWEKLWDNMIEYSIMFFTESWEKLWDNMIEYSIMFFLSISLKIKRNKEFDHRKIKRCVYNMIEYSIMFFTESWEKKYMLREKSFSLTFYKICEVIVIIQISLVFYPF